MSATRATPTPLARSAWPRSAWSRGADTFAVGVLCLVVLGVADLIIDHEHGVSGDGPFYDAMAAHPGRAHNFPYAYRLAVPWLVHVLPFSQVVSFTIIGLLATAGTGAALYALMRDFHAGRALATWLVIGFVLSPTLLIVLVRHFRSIDPASILVMTLGCLFIVRRRRAELLITLLVGTAVRESTIFLVPLAYVVWARRPMDWQAARDVVLTCLAPVILYFVIRTTVHAVGKQYIPGYTGSFLRARWDLVRSAGAGVEIRRLAYTYGPIWLVAPFALRDLSFARRGLVLVVLCVASMTYAYDWGRIIFLAAPVFYVSAAHVLRHHRRLAIATVAVLLAVNVGYGVYLQVHGIAHGLDSSTPHIPVY